MKTVTEHIRRTQLRETIRGLSLMRDYYTKGTRSAYLCITAKDFLHNCTSRTEARCVRRARDLWLRALGGYETLEAWCRHYGAGLTYNPDDATKRALRLRWIDKMICDVTAQLGEVV